MNGVIATIPRFQFSNALGVPLAGGTLATYLSGTTTPAKTYQDEALTVENTNPIKLDARGECVLWLDPAKSYKLVLKSVLGVTQWTQDNVSGAYSGHGERPVQHEMQTAAAGQKMFTLKKISYTPGIGSLHVYVDGFRMGPADYVETARDTVTFKDSLRKDAEVLFEAGSAVNSQSANDAAMIPYSPPEGGASTVSAALDSLFEEQQERITPQYFMSASERMNVHLRLGSMDVTAAVQAALNANAWRAELPEGVYAVSGLSVGATVREIVGIGRPVLLATGSATGPQILNVGAVDDLLVQGLIFDGNTSGATSFSNVVQTYMANRVHFDRCEWRNCRGIALLASGGSKIGVTRSRFVDCGMYHLISGSSGDRRQAFACTGVEAPYADDVDFERIGLDCISFATGSHNGRATRNRIKTTYAGSIYVANSNGFIISQNHITNGPGGGNGIDIFQSTDGAVSGNRSIGCGAAGILLADCKRVAVTGNVCKNNWQGKASLHRGGITLSSTSAGSMSNITLSGNVCCDDQGAGAVTQRYAVGVYTTGSGSYNNICIDPSNALTGYNSGGAPDATSIFQTTALGIVGFPFLVNLADQGEIVLYKADGTYGEFNVVQSNNNLAAKFSVRHAGGALELLDPSNAFETTDSGTTQTIYYDAASSTVRLKNRTGSLKTYAVIPTAWTVTNAN